ncbi:MAG: (2Fe-2S)-binding protein [Phycisphaerales bacterium]|nr:(2Fe-2S)-binding protein [Phycisphaerales bacterium]
MQPDDEICLCFHVTQRKINAYLRRENPPVPSLISECLGAGTGCGWCVPILEHLHAEHQRGGAGTLDITPERYAEARKIYRVTSERRDVLDETGRETG